MRAIVYLTIYHLRRLRERKLVLHSGDEVERQAQLQKKWSLYKWQEKQDLFLLYERTAESHQTALRELRKESEELYIAAIQSDSLIFPITMKGPVRTPPNKNYESPAEYPKFPMYSYANVSILQQDGDYIDVSKKWE